MNVIEINVILTEFIKLMQGQIKVLVKQLKGLYR